MSEEDLKEIIQELEHIEKYLKYINECKIANIHKILSKYKNGEND